MRAQWIPWAIRDDGPSWKTSGNRVITKFVVYHSAEGYESGMLSVLHGSKESSWQGSIMKDGRLLQHYAMNIFTWHAKGANAVSPGFEHEGVAGEPLTSQQIETDARLSAWFVKEDWLPRLERGGPMPTMVEHQEVGRLIAFPRYVTECPSGRIPWLTIIARANQILGKSNLNDKGDDDMLLLREEGRPAIYLVGGLHKQYVADLITVNKLRAIGVEMKTVPQGFLSLFRTLPGQVVFPVITG